MKVLDYRKTGLKADRKAALIFAVNSSRLDPFSTSFEGQGILDMIEFKKCAEKTIAKYIRTPW